MAEGKKIKLLEKINNSFSVTKDGGISEKAAALQYKVDELIEKGLNKVTCLAEKIFKWVDVTEEGGLSERMLKCQEIADYWVDLVEDQLEKDVRLFKKLFKKISGYLIRSVSVTQEGGISSIAAKVMNRVDFAISVIADNLFFQLVRLKKWSDEIRIRIWKNRVPYLKHLAVAVIVTICLLSVFNHVTGYEYSYNGRVLGLVKTQEEAIKVLDIASRGLTSEYGVTVQIDPKEDISFRKVVTVNRTLDTADDVLKKFTYMQDTKATAYAIYVDRVQSVVVDTDATACFDRMFSI